VSRPRRLTATSHVVLGLLCVRDWSAYELVRQVERGWSDVWPRAGRGIYDEPRKLVHHGLATSRSERQGARDRTVYAVTDAGRHAFRAWLHAPPAPPAFESEALVRVVFADQGSVADLRRSIGAVREHARTRAATLLTQGADYLATGGPFPERVHLLHLTGGFLAEQFAAMLRWADWAEAELDRWPDTGPADVVPDLAALGADVARRMAAVAAAGEAGPTGASGGQPG
jgi:PadR family transcriptional regulator AphA